MSSARALVGPVVTSIASTASQDDDAFYNVFQGINGFRSTTITIGNFFLGLQGYGALRFRGMGIPRNAKIHSARLDVVAVANSGAAMTIDIKGLGHQGRRQTHWKRVDPVHAWQIDFWGTFNGLVRDAGAGTVADLSPGGDQVNATWGLQFEDTHGRDEAAQQFTLAVPTEIADVVLKIQKSGAPTGNVVVRIEGSKTEQAYNEPDGAVYAQSVIPAASIPVGVSDFTFPLGTQTLQPGTYHVVLSRAGAPIDNANWIAWTQRRAFFNTPPAKHKARAAGFGYGNYPGYVDVGSAGKTDATYVWNAPTFVIGFTMGAIGIEEIIQEVVDKPGYKDGDPLGLALTANAGSASRRFAAFEHATYAAPKLTVTWQRRAAPSGGIAGAGRDDEEIAIIAAAMLLGAH